MVYQGDHREGNSWVASTATPLLSAELNPMLVDVTSADGSTNRTFHVALFVPSPRDHAKLQALGNEAPRVVNRRFTRVRTKRAT